MLASSVADLAAKTNGPRLTKTPYKWIMKPCHGKPYTAGNLDTSEQFKQEDALFMGFFVAFCLKMLMDIAPSFLG
jgi:hypothetical protein